MVFEDVGTALPKVSLRVVDVRKTCTTILVTKGASADGSTFVTHSNDSLLSDPSFVYVPARDYPSGAKRKVYPSALAIEEIPALNCFYTPRLVDADRAPGYDFKDRKPTTALDEIEQVEHTYAYIDSDYGVMNEHGLMLGECTNHSGRLEKLSAVESEGIFYASELGRVALERCRTAREAVELMGALIDEHGLWGTGETLLVADRDEGWVFECMPTPTGEGGLWIAQRVPDGEVFVAANQFRIRSINADNPNQIFNPALPDQLKALGWTGYDGVGNLDWLRSIAGSEEIHPYYSMRRVWRVMNLIAPSKKLPTKVNDWSTYEYPFSIRPDLPLTLRDVMNVHRDYYKGTNFDRSIGDGAGLFGSPYRYDDLKRERAITDREISYIWLLQANEKLPRPLAWLSMNAALDSVYVPLTVSKLPPAYEQVDNNRFDGSKMWWVSTQVSMLTRGYFDNLIGDVRAEAARLETRSIKLIKKSVEQSEEEFSATLIKNAALVQDDWRRLYETLLERCNRSGGLKSADGAAEDVEHY